MSKKKKGDIDMGSLFSVNDFVDVKAVLEQAETEELLYRVNQMIADGEKLKAELEEKRRKQCGSDSEG